MQAITMSKLDEQKPLQNGFKRIYHKLHSMSMKNNLTNICSKISKIVMNFWMVYIILSMKSSGKYK